MRTLFVTVSAAYEKVPTKLLETDTTLQEVAKRCLDEVQGDFWDIGLKTTMQGSALLFKPSEFSHLDVIHVIQDHQYNYADFGGTSFPTNRYSENGKDMEYYLKKRFEDYDVVVCLNKTQGSMAISDLKYVTVEEPAPEDSAATGMEQEEKPKPKPKPEPKAVGKKPPTKGKFKVKAKKAGKKRGKK